MTENAKPVSDKKSQEGFDSNFKLENITLWKSALFDIKNPNHFHQIMSNRVLVLHHLNNALLEEKKKANSYSPLNKVLSVVIYYLGISLSFLSHCDLTFLSHHYQTLLF